MEFTQSQLALAGAIAALVAAVAWIGDHRRRKRKDIDAVGFVDWTTIYFIALLLAVLLLGGAVRVWLTG